MSESIEPSEATENSPRYTVLINGEEQYSLWRVDREIPGGWEQVQFPNDWERDYRESHPEAGSKDVCLAYIEEKWTDMRPLSVRRAAARRARSES